MSGERYRVKVAVYLILIRNGKILLQLRKGTDYMCGVWGVPSGHLESGESCVAALVRETREETGLEFDQDDLICSLVQHRVGSEYLCLYYTVRPGVKLAEPHVMEPDKCAGLEFFDLHTLPDSIVPELKDYLLTRVNGCFYTDDA